MIEKLMNSCRQFSQGGRRGPWTICERRRARRRCCSRGAIHTRAHTAVTTTPCALLARRYLYPRPSSGRAVDRLLQHNRSCTLPGTYCIHASRQNSPVSRLQSHASIFDENTVGCSVLKEAGLHEDFRVVSL